MTAALVKAASGVINEMTWRLQILVCILLASTLAVPCFAGETATLKNGFTIHYERRESMGETTRLFLTDSTDNFVDVPTNEIAKIEVDKVPAAAAPPTKPESQLGIHHPIRLDEALSAASQKNNISPELLRSVIRAESGFNPNARSAKGAQGLMQLMPATAAQMGVRDAFDPAQNVDGGARYLSQLLGRYNNNLTIALAAYNAGPQRVERYHGVPPFPETISYVSRVLQNFDGARSGANLNAFFPKQRPATREKESSAPNLDSIRKLQNAILAGDKQTELETTDSDDSH